MFWFKVWLVLAAAMLTILILTKATPEVLGISFLAWCGGIVSTLMLQERYSKHPVNLESFEKHEL